jgi:hypothetical protein
MGPDASARRPYLPGCSRAFGGAGRRTQELFFDMGKNGVFAKRTHLGAKWIKLQVIQGEYITSQMMMECREVMQKTNPNWGGNGAAAHRETAQYKDAPLAVRLRPTEAVRIPLPLPIPRVRNFSLFQDCPEIRGRWVPAASSGLER